MEFVEVIEGFNRMCDSMDSCGQCKISDSSMGCDGEILKNPKKVEAIVSAWLAAHPKKTYLTEVLKHFPDTPIHAKYKYPIGFCPGRLGMGIAYCSHDNYSPEDCLKCWNTEVI